MLGKQTYHELNSMFNHTDSDLNQEYNAVLDLFKHTKRIYSKQTPFLVTTDLDLQESSHVEISRKANIATFASSLLGTQDLPLVDLTKNFLEIFVPEGGRLLKIQGHLLLDLMTQTFISYAMDQDRSVPDLLMEIFADGLDSKMMRRRPGSRSLAPSEQDFFNRAMSRREILLKDVRTQEGLAALPDKYRWEDFMRGVHSYVEKNLENIISPNVRLLPP